MEVSQVEWGCAEHKNVGSSRLLCAVLLDLVATADAIRCTYGNFIRLDLKWRLYEACVA